MLMTTTCGVCGMAINGGVCGVVWPMCCMAAWRHVAGVMAGVVYGVMAVWLLLLILGVAINVWLLSWPYWLFLLLMRNIMADVAIMTMRGGAMAWRGYYYWLLMCVVCVGGVLAWYLAWQLALWLFLFMLFIINVANVVWLLWLAVWLLMAIINGGLFINDCVAGWLLLMVLAIIILAVLLLLANGY